jgi:ProP effector
MHNDTIDAAVAELARQFPKTFATDPAQVRLLKLGILRDIYAQSVLSHRRISAALRSYCHSVQYLQASVEGAARLNLAGEPAGTVTAKEADSARRRLVAKWSATARAASKTVSNPAGVASTGGLGANRAGTDHPTRTSFAVVAPKPGPHRLGLADLKKAAMARKTPVIENATSSSAFTSLASTADAINIGV